MAVRDRAGSKHRTSLQAGSRRSPRSSTALRTHLADSPMIGDTLWWLVSRFVIPVHERIAYSKLPEFTFRFRWEDGLLRFYDHGQGRFPLAAIRNEPLAYLTWDLGFWDATEDDNVPAVLTERGSAFIDEALA